MYLSLRPLQAQEASFVFCFNRPFLSSPQSLFQIESNCEIFVVVISSNLNMNENWSSLEMEAEVDSEMAS